RWAAILRSRRRRRCAGPATGSTAASPGGRRAGAWRKRTRSSPTIPRQSRVSRLAPLGLFAGALFGGAERLGQSVPGTARLDRLGLRFMRRPTVQEQDVETRRHAARRLGEPLAIDLGCTYERGAARQSPTAFDHEIAFT